MGKVDGPPSKKLFLLIDQGCRGYISTRFAEFVQHTVHEELAMSTFQHRTLILGVVSSLVVFVGSVSMPGALAALEPCTGKVWASVALPCGKSSECNLWVPCGGWFEAQAGVFDSCTSKGAIQTDNCIVLQGDANLLACGNAGVCIVLEDDSCGRVTGSARYTRRVNPDGGPCVASPSA